jgi:hypothetical protein
MSESGKVSLPSMTPERIEENKLKKGDRVVMHTCIESEELPGKIWTCKTDQFTRGKGVFAQDSVFLEGYSGSFAPEFLQKVILPSEDEAVLAALEESQQQVEESKIREIDLEEQYKTLYRMYTDMDESCGETLDLLKGTSGSLVEAQQTIASLQSEKERFDSLMVVLKDATELMSWRDPGSSRGQEEALKKIYIWLSENPSPKYLAALEGNKEGSDKE